MPLICIQSEWDGRLIVSRHVGSFTNLQMVQLWDLSIFWYSVWVGWYVDLFQIGWRSFTMEAKSHSSVGQITTWLSECQIVRLSDYILIVSLSDCQITTWLSDCQNVRLWDCLIDRCQLLSSNSSPSWKSQCGVASWYWSASCRDLHCPPLCQHKYRNDYHVIHPWNR